MRALAQIGDSVGRASVQAAGMANVRTRVIPLTIVLVLGLAACGGSSDAGGGGTTTTKAAAGTTTTAKPTTTTTEAPKADEATKAEAASRIFTEDDFPEGWTVAVKALPYDRKGIKADDCINPKGGPISTLPLGAAAGGPTMKAPDANAFVGSWAATFADEDQAAAFVDQITSPENATCTAKTLQAGGKGRKDFAVKVTSKSPEESGVGRDHRVASNSYELSEAGEVVSILYVDSYQIGRTVVTVNLELGGMTDEQAAAASAVEAQLRGEKFGS
jgi:hypothetical protein